MVFNVCVLHGNFEVNCGLEGCFLYILKGVLTSNFMNQMFVILQGRSGLGKCQEDFWKFQILKFNFLYIYFLADAKGQLVL